MSCWSKCWVIFDAAVWFCLLNWTVVWGTKPTANSSSRLKPRIFLTLDFWPCPKRPIGAGNCNRDRTFHMFMTCTNTQILKNNATIIVYNPTLTTFYKTWCPEVLRRPRLRCKRLRFVNVQNKPHLFQWRQEFVQQLTRFFCRRRRQKDLRCEK